MMFCAFGNTDFHLMGSSPELQFFSKACSVLHDVKDQGRKEEPWRCTWVVEHLPSICQTLGLLPSRRIRRKIGEEAKEML